MSFNVSRRWFIGGAAAFGALPGCMGISRATGKPNLTFGIVSDVHVRMKVDRSGMLESNNCDTLIHTFEWFRDQGVDAVMIAGDMADHGMVEEMEAIAGAWFKVFPNDRAPDGRKVERLFVYGNHDWEGFKYGDFAKKVFPDETECAKHILRTDYAGNWQRIWHEPFAPVWMKNVKGYSFVGAHWAADHCRGKNEVGMVGVGDFFAANGKQLDPKQPFFYFQHPHPHGTCYGKEAWGQDDAVKGVTPVLSKYANAVAFSGHSHYTLTDERSVWQGAFTSIGTASLRYTSVCGEGFENRGNGLMKGESTRDERQGMLAKVYGDHIAICRRDFIRDAMLGDDWLLPLPAAESRPFEYKARAAKLGAPQFAKGATATVAKVTGTVTKTLPLPADAKPKKKPKTVVEEVQALEVTFPAATAATRVFSYLVAHAGADGKVKTHKILAPGYHRPPKSKEALAPVKYLVALDQLPKATSVNFTITPVSSHGVKGRPIAVKF